MNGKRGSVEKRPNEREQIAAGAIIGAPASIEVPVTAAIAALRVRERKRAETLGNALALKDVGYLNGLARIAAACSIDEGELSKAYDDNADVRDLIEKPRGRYRILKARRSIST